MLLTFGRGIFFGGGGWRVCGGGAGFTFPCAHLSQQPEKVAVSCVP